MRCYLSFLLLLCLSGLIRADEPDKGLKLKINSTEINGDLKARTSFAPMIKRVSNSIVTIQADQLAVTKSANEFFNDPFFEKFFKGTPKEKRKHHSLGSGVIISEDGYVVTNNHVINKATRVKVRLKDRRVFTVEIIGTDPKTDIALLKI